MTENERSPVPADDAEARLHDMGGATGPTPPGSRGGGGLGPAEVREADEAARRGDEPPTA